MVLGLSLVRTSSRADFAYVYLLTVDPHNLFMHAVIGTCLYNGVMTLPDKRQWTRLVLPPQMVWMTCSSPKHTPPAHNTTSGPAVGGKGPSGRTPVRRARRRGWPLKVRTLSLYYTALIIPTICRRVYMHVCTYMSFRLHLLYIWCIISIAFSQQF